LAPRKKDAEEKTCIKGMCLSSNGDNSNVAAVDVKDGKIIRIRPFHYDWKYKPEEFNPWKLEAHGKTFTPPLKVPVPPHGLAYKKRVQSPNRVLYPMKRVDWDPDGERNPQNRGKSGYVRISWDEAATLIAKEIKRVHKKYGPEAILLQSEGHGETKVVHAAHGCPGRLLDSMGGFTLQVRNPDSWEGWFWGAKHVWGCEPVGTYNTYQGNIYDDVAKNTNLLIHQGSDPETTPWGFGGGFMPGLFCYWYTEIGIKQIFISPDLNYAAAVHADKWIPVLPNTDAALQLAIAYEWLTHDTYDKKYIATHTVGFDKLKDYVLGKEDGIAKTPVWAAKKCGVPSRIIKALARDWASKATTVTHGFGGPYIRGPYSTEPARLEVCLLAMQGLGKPGVHQLCFVEGTFLAFYTLGKEMGQPTPLGLVRPMVRAAYRGFHARASTSKQIIPKTMIHDAILNGAFEIWGSSDQMANADDQFKKYRYPTPGCSEVHMMWSDTPCFATCWNDGNSIHKAYQSPKIECYVMQHPWMENECLFADIILPIATKFELNDIGTDMIGCQYNSIYLEKKCIEPIGESRSDYEAVAAVAEKLGKLAEYTENKSVDEWIKIGFDKSGVPEAGLCTWEKFKEKDYYVIPTDPDWKRFPAGMLEFYKDPENHPLMTPTGKLEIYSERLAKYFGNDDERPPSPRWIERSEHHDERISGDRAKKYPLLVMSNHPRWRVHAQLDDITWFHEIETCKVRGPDGYLYEPIWIHPTDAANRGIKNGDVVKIYNERGGVLVGAYVTERIIPGAVYVDHGARNDAIIPGELDRGGAINTITPHYGSGRNCRGAMVVSGFLAEVEPVNLDELRVKYPEAFNRPYDYASGLLRERVLYEGEKK
jgi:trimethylamine-N-oxide reductase (cytochrome c)